MRFRCIVLTLALLAAGTPATVASAVENDPFAQGRMGISIYFGGGQTSTDSYYTAGAGFSYYLVNGLWLGLSGETRQGIDPTLYKASPEIGYVFPLRGPVRPYVGAFYRRVWVENYEDYDTYGGRAGVNVRMGQGAWFRIGGVYESLRNCANTPVNLPCSDSYGELGVLFSF